MSRFKPDDTTLTSAQERLIIAMLSCTSVRDAAKEAHIAEKTAWNCLALPQVKAALQEARDDIRTQAIDLLKSETLQSVETIITLRDDTKVFPQYRLKAAQLILEMTMKAPADSVTADQDYSAYDMREFLAACTSEELSVINPIIKAVAARKAEQDQPENIQPLRRVK